MSANAVTRIAVALSGGVDSSVTALLLHRCVRTRKDLSALRFGHDRTAPEFDALLHAVCTAIPWSTVTSFSLPFSEAAEEDEAPVELFPFFYRCWDDVTAERGWCTAAEGHYNDALSVARALGIVRGDRSLTVVDLTADYAERCFEPMLAAYSRGRTLNVDALCNSEVKFGALVEDHLRWLRRDRVRRGFSSFDKHPCELLATGHYARVVWVDAGRSRGRRAYLARPLAAHRSLNDQSVFLAGVDPSLWGRALFPIGHLFRQKDDVRRLCSAYGEASGSEVWRTISRKKTSTGMCFVGEVVQPRGRRRGSHAAPSSPSCSSSRSGAFTAFLSEYLPPAASEADGNRSRHANANAFAAAPSTRFFEVVSADSGDSGEYTLREIPATRFRWEGGRGGGPWGAAGADGLPRLLPAYAFTVGQRLRCLPTDAEGRRGGAGRTLYVLRKLLCQREGGGDEGGLDMAEVHLVSRWDHPLFFTKRVCPLAAVTWHVPLSVLGNLLQQPDEGRADGGRCLRCLGCTRHLEALRPCWLSHLSPTPPEADGEAQCEGDRPAVGTARVRVDDAATPFRAPSAGQLFVAYVPLSRLTAAHAAAGLTDDTQRGAADANADAEADPLVVVASGWVTEGEGAATP